RLKTLERIRIARVRRDHQAVPKVSLHVILLHSASRLIKKSEIRLSVNVSLIGSLLPPLRGLLNIFSYAQSLRIDHTQSVLGQPEALTGSGTNPFERLLIKCRKDLPCLLVAFIRRAAVPFERFLTILLNSLAIVIHRAEIVLRRCKSLVRGE